MNNISQQYDRVNVLDDQEQSVIFDADEAEKLFLKSSSKNSLNSYENSGFQINLTGGSSFEDKGANWILTENENLVYVTNDVDMISINDQDSNECPTENYSVESICTSLPYEEKADSSLVEEFEEITVTDQQLQADDDSLLYDERQVEYLRPSERIVDLENRSNDELSAATAQDTCSIATGLFDDDEDNDELIPDLFIIAPKDNCDSCMQINEDTRLDVEHVICLITCALFKSNLGIVEPNAKLICEHPTVFKLTDVNLKDDAGILKLAYVVALDDIESITQQIQSYNFNIRLDYDSVRRILNRLLINYDQIIKKCDEANNNSINKNSNNNNINKNNNNSNHNKNKEDLSDFVGLISSAKYPIDIKKSGEIGLSRFVNKNNQNDKKEEIAHLERLVYIKHKELSELKRRLNSLKKEMDSLKESLTLENDLQIANKILGRYLDSDGVKFFEIQMKTAGKKGGAYRWSDEDKLFALKLLYKNSSEYNMLAQRFTIPTVKTLNKFVSTIKKAEQSDNLIKLEKTEIEY